MKIMTSNKEMFKKNLAAFSIKTPGLNKILNMACPGKDVEVLLSRKGLPVLTNRIAFHSLIDPEKEALVWAHEAEKKLRVGRNAAIFGFGMGYHIKGLLDLGIPSVAVIEPDPSVIKIALEYIDFRSYAERMTLITEEVKAFYLKNMALIPHRPTACLHRETYARWKKLFELSQGLHETVTDVMRDFEGVEEVYEFLGQFAPDKKVSISEFAKAISPGPLKDWQIIFLLMKELEETTAFS